jgi:photosystem II stability/assembly factor-like uncharacterized protein
MAALFLRASVYLLLLQCSTVTAFCQEWTSFIFGQTTSSIAVNPRNHSTIYVGGIGRVFYKTVNGGALWEEGSVGAIGGDAFMSSMIVHPIDTNIVLAAGDGHEGISRSTDGGETWQTVASDASVRRFHVVSDGLIAHPESPDTLYALRHTPMIVYRSTNRGATWDSLSVISTVRPTDRARAFTIAPDSTNIILASGRLAEVHRSTDGGRTFSVAQRIADHPDGDVSRFVWSPTMPGTVYAVCLKYVPANVPNNGGVVKSTDWGVTWERIALDNVSLNAIEAIPGPNAFDELYVGGASFFPAPEEIVGSTVVRRSVDGGANFSETGTIPWVRDFADVPLGNVRAIKAAWIPGAPSIFMATESGLFVTSPVMSVHQERSANHPFPVMAALIGTRLVLNAPEVLKGASCHVDISSMNGATVLSQLLPCEAGTVFVALPPLAHGLYSVTVRSEIGRASTTMIR